MFATVSDVEVDYGPITEPQMISQVEALLVRAEAQVRQAIPDLDARLNDGRTTEPLVVQVLSEMVAQVLRNPEGADNRTRTVGPYSESVSYVNSGSRTTIQAGLYILPRHLRLLGGRKVGAFTIAPGNPHPPQPWGPWGRQPW